MADQEDRTEAASARQIQRAREQGNVPLSQELPAFAVLASMTLLTLLAAPAILRRLARDLIVLLDGAARIDPVAGLQLAGWITLRAAAPFVVAALLAGAAAVLLQTGFLLSPAKLLPDFGKLDPRQGLRRVFGLAALTEIGKSLLKVAVVSWAGWRATAALLPQLPLALQWDADTLLAHLSAQLWRILVFMLAAQAAIAGLDMARVRFQHGRTLRMSRQDLRDEHREMEGDPKVKGRIRQIRAQRQRRRMLAAVPTATVVLTNPTHYAVALAYERGSGGAPRVVAKGTDEVAARIRQVARDAGVPVVPNPPLARALHLVPLDAEIPAEHFKMVAGIIAYVWRLRAKAGPAPHLGRQPDRNPGRPGGHPPGHAPSRAGVRLPPATQPLPPA